MTCARRVARPCPGREGCRRERRDDADPRPGHRKDVTEWRTQPDAECWPPGSPEPRWACSAGAPRRRAPTRRRPARADATPRPTAPATTTTLPPKRPTADGHRAARLRPDASSWRPVTSTRSSLDAGARTTGDHAAARQPPGATPTSSRGHPRHAAPWDAATTTSYDASAERRSPTPTCRRWPPPPTTSSRRSSPPTPTCSAGSRASTAPSIIASILIVEARPCAVLADMAGSGDDFDALFVNDARRCP